jgi:hypothetical protein
VQLWVADPLFCFTFNKMGSYSIWGKFLICILFWPVSMKQSYLLFSAFKYFYLHKTFFDVMPLLIIENQFTAEG